MVHYFQLFILFNIYFNMKTSKYIILFVLVFYTAGILSTFGQSYKIVVNSSNTTNSITKKEASDFFLKKKTKWSNGSTVIPVDLSSRLKIREDFSQQVHGKSTAAVRNFWQQAAFSGTASAPAEKSTDSEVMEFVKKNAGAIGYVSSSANTSDVKILNVN